jgi:23S rRNA G2445 N2-methylase RlmL
MGGDRDAEAIRAAGANLRRAGPGWRLARWDARRLPLAGHSVDRIVCNPPFGVQLGEPWSTGPLYRELANECDRVLTPGGRAVILVGDATLWHPAATAVGWRSTRRVRVRLLGQRAEVSVWRKPAAEDSMTE